MTTDRHKATPDIPSVVWLTRSEAAALLRISPHTFDRYRREGKIRRYRTPGSHPRYRRDDVLALLTSRDEDAAASA